MLANLQQELRDFYRENSIYPTPGADFACPHRHECKGGNPDFVEARLPSIGSRYFDDSTPRFVVISLDPGSETRDASERDIVVRIADGSSAHWPENRHWYQTHVLVAALLKRFDPEMNVDAAGEHFAHLNAAKCCANLKGNRQAPNRMFDNCRWYLPGEVRLFNPQVIVTQGDRAAWSFAGAFPAAEEQPFQCTEEKHRCSAKILNLGNGAQALWLHTYHPNQRSGLFYRSLPGYAACYAKWIGEFVA